MNASNVTHNSRMTFHLGVCILLVWMTSFASAQSTWQKSLDELDKRQAKELAAMDRKLITELDVLIKKAVRESKLDQANAMSARKAALESEAEILEKNAAPTSASMEAASRQAARELEGKVWNLENTTNVKAIAVKDAKVFAATPDGRLSASPQADKQMLPRMFSGKRSDGDMSYYIFSPDLKQVLGLTSRSYTEMTEVPKKP
jgi:hypothetical protein